MADVIDYRFKFRRGLATSWSAKNPVLLEGEAGWEKDTGKIKVGDGATPWNALEYLSGGIEVQDLEDFEDNEMLIYDATISKFKRAPAIIEYTGAAAPSGDTITLPAKCDKLGIMRIGAITYAVPLFYMFGRVSMKLTIDKNLVSGSLTDFPIYIDLSIISDAEFWNTITASGGDIRVFQSNGVTELAREVVWVDKTSKKGELHVKMDSLSDSADTDIIIQVDGDKADYAPSDEYGRNAVWSGSVYEAVYHFSDLSITDSTGNGHHGTAPAGCSIVDGLMGRAISKSTTNPIILDNSAALQLGFPLALQCVANAQTASAHFVSTDSWSYGGYSLYGGAHLNRSGSSIGDGGDPIAANRRSYSTTPLSGDIYATALFSGVNAQSVYVDGISLSGTYTGTATSMSFTSIPANIGAGFPYSEFSEVRYCKVLLSEDWIVTEYNNQSSPSTFFKSVTKL